MKFLKKKTSIVILMIVLLFIFLLGLLIKKTNENYEKKNANKTNISENIDNNKTINIALFGLDRRHENESARSDSIMIANIDFKNKTINLVSLLRDTLVDIKGHGKDKLNHAYAYGGPELAIETINSNFDLNLDKYVSVDFYSLAKVVDIVGGVEINLKDYEVDQINNNLVEINNIEKLPEGTDYIDGSGIKTLNGRQAVAYCRIRKEGNGDYERTERQRAVLKGLITKYEKLDSGKRFEVSMEMINQVETNIPINDIKKLENEILNQKDFTINQKMIPYEGSFKTDTVDGMWVIEANMEENIKVLHEYLK